METKINGTGMKKINLLIAIILLTTTVFAQVGFGGGNKDLVKIEVHKSFDNVHRDSEFKFAVKADIEETWHINSHQPNEDFLIATKVELAGDVGFQLADIKYPEAKDLEFGFSDNPVSVYEGGIIIGGIVKVAAGMELGEYNLPVKLTYQACNDATCLPPKSVEKELLITIVDNDTPINEINADVFSQIDLTYTPVVDEAEEGGLASTLESSGLFLSLLFVFLGGLALNLTPCVYPLIPITIGYFGGQSEGNTGKLFMLGVFYVLGMAVTYSAIGVITSLSGAVFGALLQNPYVIMGVALVLLALSLSMFGLYEFKMPDSWVNKAGGASTGVVGALFMGLTMGVVAAPCIGPFVLGLVTYVGAKGDPFYGFMMFFFLALGLGSPYLFLAVFSGKIKSLPRAGTWMEAVKYIFGFILIGMALYFLDPILPEILSKYALPVFMIFSALYLIFIDKKANKIIGFKIFKIVLSVAVIALSVYLLIPSEKQSPAWETYASAAYEQALNSNQKIMIDFYADWCIPCKELDALTFSDERVIEKSKEFVTYKVDMTQTMSDQTETIRNKFEIVGMPTILFIDSEGNEVERVTGFVNAEEMLKIMNKVN